MMKLRLVVFPMLLALLAPACFAGPFGLDAGMTRGQVIQKIGKNAIVKESAHSVTFSTAPTPNRHFSKYRCSFARNGKLAQVKASSPPVAMPVIDGFLTTFEILKSDLEDKYGKATGTFGYRAGASKKQWDKALISKRAVAGALWYDHNDKLYAFHLSSIALGVQPVDKERCVLTLVYNFNVSEEPGL